MGNTNQILCIKNIEIETLGSFREYLLDDGFAITDILANKKAIQSQKLSEYDFVFILGGPMSVNDNYDYLIEEKKLIQNAIEHGVPVLGICLGSQLIASACGGSVYKGLEKQIGWGNVDITDSGFKSIFRGIPEKKMVAFHWHGDTFSLPSETEILATSNLYIQAFRYKCAVGIQFHLEVDKEMIKNWSKCYQLELDADNISTETLLNDKDKKFSEIKSLSKRVYNNFKNYVGN